MIYLDRFDVDKEDDAGRRADEWMRESRKKGDKLWKLNFDSDNERVERLSTDSSKFRGVSKVKRTGRWRATIWDGHKVNLGTYATQEEAAKAYDVKALELGRPTNFSQYGECNPEVNGKVVPQHDKWDSDGRGTSPRPRGRR